MIIFNGAGTVTNPQTNIIAAQVFLFDHAEDNDEVDTGTPDYLITEIFE